MLLGVTGCNTSKMAALQSEVHIIYACILCMYRRKSNGYPYISEVTQLAGCFVVSNRKYAQVSAHYATAEETGSRTI